MAPWTGGKKNRPVNGKTAWTDDERRGLKILFENPKLLNPDTPTNRNNFQRIFAQVFPDQGRKSYEHLYDQYQPRHSISKRTKKPERGQQWFVIDRPDPRNNIPYTQEERDELMRVETDLRNAAAAMTPGVQAAVVATAVEDGEDLESGETEGEAELGEEGVDDHEMKDGDMQDFGHAEQEPEEEDEQPQQDAIDDMPMQEIALPPFVLPMRYTLYTSKHGTRLTANISFQSGGAELLYFDQPETPMQQIPYLHVTRDCEWDESRGTYKSTRNIVPEAFINVPAAGLPACAQRFTHWMVLQRIHFIGEAELSMAALCRHETCRICAEVVASRAHNARAINLR